MFGEGFVVFDNIKETIFLKRYSAVCAQKLKSLSLFKNRLQRNTSW